MNTGGNIGSGWDRSFMETKMSWSEAVLQVHDDSELQLHSMLAVIKLKQADKERRKRLLRQKKIF